MLTNFCCFRLCFFIPFCMWDFAVISIFQLCFHTNLLCDCRANFSCNKTSFDLVLLGLVLWLLWPCSFIGSRILMLELKGTAKKNNKHWFGSTNMEYIKKKATLIQFTCTHIAPLSYHIFVVVVSFQWVHKLYSHYRNSCENRQHTQCGYFCVCESHVLSFLINKFDWAAQILNWTKPKIAKQQQQIP